MFLFFFELQQQQTPFGFWSLTDVTKQANKYTISVNDVTAVSTQEAHMCAS